MNTILVGAQWGDEGKGKIIDVLTEEAAWIVRPAGGNNAGHTVEVGSERFVLHLLPSGILHPGKKCVIGNGVVLDPAGLVGELEGVTSRGIDVAGRFFISDRAHVVCPYHKRLDGRVEAALKKQGGAIGTTMRGIGPTYSDKAARTGIRMCDLMSADFPELLKARVEAKNRELEALGGETFDYEEVLSSMSAAAEKLRPFVCDTVPLLFEAAQRGEPILFEGAQGVMLDLDFGTYPFVTSSSAAAGGACTGSGVAPNCIDRVVGVVKAYTTRVGEGPFPTELFDADGEKLREAGREYGATTGRPRRCGWFDAVVARWTRMLCGVDEWALTKLDVLDGFDEIKVCTAYELDGRRIDYFPLEPALEKCRPVYEYLPGFDGDITGCRRFAELPGAAQAYVKYLEDAVNCHIRYISVGADREQYIDMDR